MNVLIVILEQGVNSLNSEPVPAQVESGDFTKYVDNVIVYFNDLELKLIGVKL